MTRRYYLTNTARPHNGATADNEFALDDFPGSGTTSQSVPGLTSERLIFSWITAAGEPNAYEWPNTSNHQAQLDVTAAGANLSYGFRDQAALGISGAFEMTTSSDGSADSIQQTQAAFTGTGLKLASASGWLVTNPVARSNKFALLLSCANSNVSAQTLTLRFGSDAWTEGPWLSKQAYSPQMLMGVGY